MVHHFVVEMAAHRVLQSYLLVNNALTQIRKRGLRSVVRCGLLEIALEVAEASVGVFDLTGSWCLTGTSHGVVF